MTSNEGDNETVAAVQGLATSRSRRTKKDKQGRLAALQKLKELKSTGQRIKYEVADIENVYDEVDESQYSETVQKRLDDDWIEDDGAGDYIEDGRELFDDEPEATNKKSNVNNKGPKSASHGKKKIKVVKSSDIKQMLLSAGSKKKSEKSVDLSKDELLGDILQEMKSQPTDPLSMPRAPVLIKKKKRLPATPDSLIGSGCAMMSPTYNAIPSNSTTPPSSMPRRRMKPRNIVQPAPITDDLPFMCTDEPVTPPAKRTKTEPGHIKSENLNKTISSATVEEPKVKIEPTAEMMDTSAFDDCDDDEMLASIEVQTKVAEKKKKPVFTEQLSSLGWETVKQESTESLDADIVVDSSSLPMTVNEAGDKVFRFFWLDAYVEPYKNPGVVYLFGKVYIESAKKYASCCVTVKNVQRKIYLLPRDVNKKTGEEVSPQDVYQEFDSEVADRYRIMKFKTKIVEKKYAFGVKDIPHLAQYVEITYPAEHGVLASDLSGDTFQCIFGANQSPLEALLLERKIKGPSWIDIKKPHLSTSCISWCKVEATVLDASDLCVVENIPTPPLVVISLSMVTLPNIKTHQNEVIGMAGLVHKEFSIDKAPPKPAFQNSFFAITKPTDCIFPYDFRDAIKRKGFDVEIFGSERSLLSFVLAKLVKIDPDIIIGHDMIDFVMDVLLHRLSSCKVQHWSRLGRLKKLNIPKMSGGKFFDRSFTTGRLMCDIKISAKELIRCKSYDLAALSEHVLRRQRKELPVEQIKNMYSSSDSLLWMVEHSLLDASLALDLTCELNALPLALQITNIAGNVMSRTLMGGRSERNEFLLLHAFYEKGFIPPDKYFKKKETTNKATADTTGNEGRPRKKAAYEGGLVLEPKRGFYDKFILLLDFNSLYPSIIQEYNICFTTLNQNPPDKDEAELESYIPELPEAGLEPGVLPTEIRKLVERRKQVKQLMKASGLSKDQYTQYDIRQKALKLTANSMYGCLGFSNSRFYAKPLAALVTRQGREILMHTKELATKMGLDVIYGDTDSIMINTNSTDMDNAFKLGNQVKAEVNKLYRLLEIDIDGVYKSLLLLKKKKYAALSVLRGQDGTYSTTQELKGLDIVRRDWSDLAKMAGNFAVNQILSDQPREEIVEKIHENLQELGAKVKNKEYDFSVFEIRKELTRDPKLYPSKDSLPHVRVALRANSSMGKHYRSGDIVSYVICQDGSTNPATHRAYTIDELKNDDKLTIDGEYYLAQQVHPVVTRLCDPIDGTDASLIAQCLGLDPSGFRRSHHQEEDEEERLMSVQASEEERFSKCSKLLFVPPGGAGIEIELGCGVFAQTDPSWICTLASPCGDDPNSTLVKFFAQLQNQLTTAIRAHVHSYYKGWMVCDDPACANRSRSVPVVRDRSGTICPLCFKGIMRPEVSSKDLYQQLCFFKLQFDVEYALNKYKQNNNGSLATIRIAEYRKYYKILSEQVDFYLERSGYNQVSMTSLFDWMKIN